jgi:predicted HTH domain antitoxin
MLTKIEIDSYYYKLQKHFIDQNNLVYNSKDNDLKSLLTPNNRIVAVSKNDMSMKALAILDKYIMSSFRTHSMLETPSFSISRNTCWKHKLNEKQTEWIEDLNISSYEELHDYILTTQKCRGLDIIHDKIDFFVKIQLNNENRIFIYFSKYLEAKEVLENNITQDELAKYTYVNGYAKLMNISLTESAKLIKTQYDVLSTVLNEFELIRIEFKNLILKEKDISKLKNILEKFYIQFDRYGQL